MLSLIVQTLWFLLPPGLASLGTCVIAKRVPLGRSAFWRVVLGFFLGTGTFLFQQAMYAKSPLLRDLAYVGFAQIPLWFGGWQGVCATFADWAKSRMKRRSRPTAPIGWMPFDHVDWIPAVWIGSLPFVHFSSAHVILLLGLAVSTSIFLRQAWHLMKERLS